MENLEEISQAGEKESLGSLTKHHFNRINYTADIIFAAGVGICVSSCITEFYELILSGGFATVGGAVLRHVSGVSQNYIENLRKTNKDSVQIG